MFPVRSALLVLVVASLLPNSLAQAATLADDPAALLPQGRPMAQHFLPTGASVVTTPEGTLCVTSSRIDIATSRYVAPDGTLVPFADVVRSVASSVQAMAGAGLAAPVFRVQLKYSLKPGAAAWLGLRNGEVVEVSDLLEPSTDSLLFTGDLAVRLARAFRAGEAVSFIGISADTGRRVTDQLVSPELTLLAACQATLSPDGEASPPMAALVTLDFQAAPTPETRATVEEMRACAMTPTDRPVHLGRIRATTGFFSQTDKVFVAFDDAGRPERVYVPGILDAGLDDLGLGEARISRAADGNVPGAENAVKGCLGAAAQEICIRPMPGADGGWQLRPCWLVSGVDLASRGLFDPMRLLFSNTNGPSPVDSGSGHRPGDGSGAPPRTTEIVPPILERPPLTSPGPVPPILLTGSRSPAPPPPPLPPPTGPSPIPLPAAAWLMVGALTALALATSSAQGIGAPVTAGCQAPCGNRPVAPPVEFIRPLASLADRSAVQTFNNGLDQLKATSRKHRRKTSRRHGTLALRSAH